MTQLRIEPYDIPGAEVGPENPLPAFRDAADSTFTLDPNVPEEDRAYMGWRTGFRVLPYRMQDGYTREKRPKAFRACVLENEFLRATVLPEVGGRLVSLLYKPTNRELVDRNPVFQPANLALRNAWFCGGIEWNAGQFGHHYLTCSPVFAARVEGIDGEPALRIYEWDRVKGFTWQVDMILPEGSKYLFTRVRIVNPHDYEIPMYWWTNVGITERPGVRTLVPAQSALHNAKSGIALMGLPALDGKDITYPTNSEFAKEFFFRIPQGHRRWMAALDETGSGFFQASTDRLRGRKMFVFGMNPGGRHWKDYLMAPGCAYYEIQAGLATTQLESVPMPANTQWSWTEAFGLLEADPAKVQSEDWDTAWRAAEAALDAQLSQSWLDGYHEQFEQVTVRPPQQMLAVGSGWGALERRRLADQGESDGIPKELVFDPATLGADQEPWIALLEKGALPERDPEDGPGQMMVQGEWKSLLEDALSAGRGDHWLSWYHLAVMRAEEFDADGARETWEKSLERKRTGWALRNLAVLKGREDKHEEACELLRQAWEAGPKFAKLAVEYVQALLKLARYADVCAFAESLSQDIACDERIRLFTAKAALEMGRLEGFETLFDREMSSIREGEVTLSELWFELHERRIAAAENVEIDDKLRRRVRAEFPPPAHIDFRMGSELG